MSKWPIDWASCTEHDRTLEVKDFSLATPRAQVLNAQVVAVLGARRVPDQVFSELAKEHIQHLVHDTFESASPQHGLPGYREARDDKTRLALQMIDAGISFTEPMCFKWLVHYLAGRVKLVRNGCHWECPQTWNAFIAPDWSQKLLPTECIFQMGECDFVEGRVVIARNPCTAPWDVQVFTALGHREIRQRFGQFHPPYSTHGVVVLSAHPSCERAPASLLAGGDYDGDRVIVVAYQSVVSYLGEPGGCNIDENVVQRLKHCHGQPARTDVATTPCDAIVQSYFRDLKCHDLAGKLANMWAYIADADGVNSSAALEIGLLHQEALDGKLNAEANGVPIWDFIKRTYGNQPLPPHWHKQALQLLQKSGSSPDAEDNGIHRLCTQSKIRRSTSILGTLFDSVRIDKLMDECRDSYGGVNYSFRRLQEGSGMPPDPLLARDEGLWLLRVPRAREILDDLFKEREQLMDARKDARERERAEKELFLKARQALFSDCASANDKHWNSVAFYHAQLERFNCRVTEGRQTWIASKVEWQLEPAWQVCAQELCFFAASRGSFCCVSSDNRGKMQYRSKPKHRSFVHSLLELSRGKDNDEEAIEVLTSMFCNSLTLSL